MVDPLSLRALTAPEQMLELFYRIRGLDGKLVRRRQ
jgi:hypothetical protein